MNVTEAIREKTCLDCRISKPVDEFGRSTRGVLGRRSYCKPCQKVRGRKYWETAGRDRQRERRTTEGTRREKLKQRYGLTEAEYQAMHDAQNGVCAICEKPEVGRRLAVDHCHQTGVVRGLLCAMCNTALGKFNDDPSLLQAALAYLQGATQ